MIIVDTNIILRYLLQDDTKLFEEAKETIENENIIILSEVVAEVVYVLYGVYGVPREEIANTLQSLFEYPNIILMPKRNYIVKALELYESKKLDFVDALLCALSQEYIVKTYDKKLQKCINKG